MSDVPCPNVIGGISDCLGKDMQQGKLVWSLPPRELKGTKNTSYSQSCQSRDLVLRWLDLLHKTAKDHDGLRLRRTLGLVERRYVSQTRLVYMQ